MQLHFQQVGEGKPLVILHGIFGSSDNWLTVGKELAKNYRVYLVDLCNHGKSPRTEQFNYQAMSAAVRQLLEEENIGKAVLLGHSMGGKVAMQVAVSYPDALEKLIVADIAPRYYPVHHDQILAGLSALDLSRITSRQEADQQLAQYEPHPTVRAFLLKNLYRNDEGKFAWRLNLPVINEQIENVGEALDENARVTIPTLFIAGTKSKYIQEPDLSLIHRIFTHATVEYIADAGHWLHAEKPAEFVAVVRDFLS